ncbi:MAG: glutamine synthetase family protein [Gammaproteobacteria bacterium]
MDEIETWLQKYGIDEVEGLVPDMAGVARGKFVPADKFNKHEGMRLPEAVFLQTVTGEYGVPADIDLSDPDMFTRPDASTLRPVPWAAEPTASVIMDCFHEDGSPVAIAPRYVLQRVLQLYEEKGLQPVVAPEVEFYLVKPNIDPDYPLEPPVGRSGRQETVRQSYSMDAINEFEALFEEIYDFCEKQNVEIDTLIHEQGAAQVEINFLHGDPLLLADQVFLFKRTVREVALRHDVYATFMAKPMAAEPGSALHLHQSVVRRDDGGNLFTDSGGKASQPFYHYIGGLQKYIPAAILLFAPYVNSYRRFARYLAAPINVHWGHDNRTVGLRVPVSDPENRRIENRVAGADVNPYLVIAASLAAGYLGMSQECEPADPIKGSAYDMPFSLARDMFGAVDALKASKPLGKILGESFVEAYCAIKEKEYANYFHVISPWEREFLLLNV